MYLIYTLTRTPRYADCAIVHAEYANRHKPPMLVAATAEQEKWRPTLHPVLPLTWFRPFVTYRNLFQQEKIAAVLYV